MRELRAIDLFCGAGGSSWGAKQAGIRPVAGFDLWDRAIEVYRANFPNALTWNARLEDVDPMAVAAQVGRVDIILASPECTNHSVAKGAAPRCDISRATAFQVTRFAAAIQPRWLLIENVTSMRHWERYREFIDSLESLGYRTRAQALDASHFGVPQRRRRLFIICDREAPPPAVLPVARTPRTARDILAMDGTYRLSPLKSARRAQATLDRAERAMAALGRDVPFLLVYYGSDHAGGWQSLDAPLRTVTTLDRFALVRPGIFGHRMRMLQVPELKAAMGMPPEFRIELGTRRERIKLVGNAVCPPVVTTILQRLIASHRQTVPVPDAACTECAAGDVFA